MTDYFTPSATFVDAIINHATVRATAQSGDYRLESSSIVENSANVILASAGGVVIFVHWQRGEYDGHVFCLEGHRGASALALVRRGLKAVFDRSNSSLVRAFAPLCLPAVSVLCRRAGFKLIDRDLFGEHFIHYGD